MEVILRDYMGRLERSAISPPASEQAGGLGEQVKPINLIIVTDGGEPAFAERGVQADLKRQAMIPQASLWLLPNG